MPQLVPVILARDLDDLGATGDLVELPRLEARRLVSDGRARYAPPSSPETAPEAPAAPITPDGPLEGPEGDDGAPSSDA